MLLGERPGFAPQIGVLVDMMHYARLTTLEAVKGLSLEELDALPDGFSNSIGMLLAHIAATGRLYQSVSFQGADPCQTPEYAPHLGATSMGEEGERVQGRTLDDLLHELEETRATTLAELARRDNSWLASMLHIPGWDEMNQH